MEFKMSYKNTYQKYSSNSARQCTEQWRSRCYGRSQRKDFL